MSPETDPILEELSRVTEPLAEKVDESENHGLFILGARIVGEDNDPEAGLQTFIDISGFTGILAEAFYETLRDQIENDNMLIYRMLKTVLTHIEEDLGIDPDAEEEPDTKRILH